VREIRDVSVVRKRAEEKARSNRDSSSVRRSDAGDDRLPDFSVDQSERSAFITDNDDQSNYGDEPTFKDDVPPDADYRDTGGARQAYLFPPYSLRTAWVPGQGVKIDYDAIIEILIQQLDGERRWFTQSQSCLGLFS
jgi:vacuole morphology and inheritance protein 14